MSAAKWIVLLLLIVFVFGYRHRISDDLINLTGESYQEILFLVFLLAAIFVAGLTFVKKLSLIPVLGLLFCLYLMIEIPAKSWLLFFFWMTTGLLIYFSYGRKKSKLAS